MSARIGVVVVSYNSATELKECIDSIRAQDSNTIKTVPIVVDNNSVDDSILVARKAKADVIENGANLGFSKAVNVGIRHAYELDCNYILILNPDAMLMKHSTSALLRALEQTPNVAAVGPIMVHADGSLANEGYYLKAPSVLTVLCFSTFLRPWALKHPFLVKRYEEQNLVSERSVEQIPGACLLTTRAILDHIGLLDEDFAIWFEDVEWSYRARMKGYKLLFCPTAKVVHEGGVSFAKWEGLAKSVTFYVSMKTFFRKHKPLSYPAVLFVLCLNSFVAYLRSRDVNHLRFIKHFLLQKKGTLPN